MVSAITAQQFVLIHIASNESDEMFILISISLFSYSKINQGKRF